jgi:hypothetical protein
MVETTAGSPIVSRHRPLDSFSDDRAVDHHSHLTEGGATLTIGGGMTTGAAGEDQSARLRTPPCGRIRTALISDSEAILWRLANAT